ncbi:MAG: helix-turn-helix transcriptional regulator [Hylemonella sp.]|nr:helix-turn-helix transcriptional regulator [Hylemonella sp.]MDP1935708.1 helix-turn-helix transcriptional regulator [Hylemonella sp.]
MKTTPLQLQQLGRTYKAMRENRGLTQAQAGESAGIPRLAVIKIEAGRGNVSIGTYNKLATALGVDLTLRPRTRPTLEEMQALS